MNHQWAIMFPFGTTVLLVGLVYGATWLSRLWQRRYPPCSCGRRHHD